MAWSVVSHDFGFSFILLIFLSYQTKTFSFNIIHFLLAYNHSLNQQHSFPAATFPKFPKLVGTNISISK